MDYGHLLNQVQQIATQFFIVMAAIGGLLKTIESVMQVVAPLTGWTWDDNLATALGKWATLKIFNKEPPPKP